MENDLLHKYLVNEASEKEVQVVFDWINQSEDNLQEFIRIKKMLALSAETYNDSAEVRNDWEDIRKSLFTRKKTFGASKILSYAAIFVILIGIGITIQHIIYNKNKESNIISNGLTSIQVPLGQTSTIILADGSEVTLNSGSSLTYSTIFSDGKRIVNLKGEAIFKVSHDKVHPFVVKTTDLDIEVYGTTFNIRAYPEEKTVSAILVEGSIGLCDKTGHQFAIMEPNEKIIYNKGSLVHKMEKVDARQEVAWVDGVFEFNNITLSELALRLENWYNVEIQIEESKRDYVIYEGAILKNKPIHQILNVIKYTSGINYKIVSRAGKPDIIKWY